MPAELRGGPPIIPPHERHGARRRSTSGSRSRSSARVRRLRVRHEPEHGAVEDALERLAQAFRRGDPAAFAAASRASATAIAGLGSRTIRRLATHRPRGPVQPRPLRSTRRRGSTCSTVHPRDHRGSSGGTWSRRRRGAARRRRARLHVYGSSSARRSPSSALIGNLYETLLYVAGGRVRRSRSCSSDLPVALVPPRSVAARDRVPRGSRRTTRSFMQPVDRALQPVLDNNFWIHIHVPTMCCRTRRSGSPPSWRTSTC